jgi:hypothetical protein
VGSDLAYPEVEGQRTVMMRLLNWYVSKLQIAAHTDPQVFIAFLKVINMVAPAPSILKPDILWRVLKANMGASQRRTNTSEEQVLWTSKNTANRSIPKGE